MGAGARSICDLLGTEALFSKNGAIEKWTGYRSYFLKKSSNGFWIFWAQKMYFDKKVSIILEAYWPFWVHTRIFEK